jgi:hypothetical protein
MICLASLCASRGACGTVDSFVVGLEILERTEDCSETGEEFCNGREDIETVSHVFGGWVVVVDGRRTAHACRRG